MICSSEIKTLNYTKEFIVKESDTIQHRVHGQLPPVCATFVLCEWMEISAGFFAQEFIDKEYYTLGRNINLSHYGAAYIGDTVVINVSTKELSDKGITFKIISKNNNRVIAKAIHTRLFIHASTFKG